MDTAPLESLRYDAMTPVDGKPRAVVRPGVVRAHAFPAGSPDLGGWYRFDFRAGLDDKGRPGNHRSGWKAHLSIDPAQVREAWDAVLPLVAGEALLAKVAAPDRAAIAGDQFNLEAGRVIAVYADGVRRAGLPSFWRKFLPAVEDALRTSGIRPGWAIRGDRPVPNSRYVHVRNERDHEGRLVEGVDAYDPFAHPSPFDGIKVTPRVPCPEPVGSPEDRVVRMLDFVASGWEPVEDGFSLLAEDATHARSVARALTYAEVPASARGDAVFIGAVDDRRLAARWHVAMEVARAGALGHAVLAATGRAGRVAVRPADGGNRPASARVTFTDPLAARHAILGLGSLARAGSPPPFLEGSVLVVPYAGRLHDSRQTERFAALAAEVATSVRDAPRGDLDAPPPEVDDVPSPGDMAWTPA